MNHCSQKVNNYHENFDGINFNSMNQQVSITPLSRFFNLLKVERQEIFSIYIYAFFSGIVTLSLPLGIQAIINLISAGQTSTSWILLVIFVIAGVAFTGILQILQLTVSENLQQKIFTRSAFEFAYRIPRMKLEAIDKSHIPELVNRFFDTLSIQKGLSKILIDFSSASLQVIFGLILLSLYHPFFILFSLVLLLIIYFIFRFTVPQGLKTSLKESSYKYEVAHWLEELARTMETFKLAGKTPLPLAKTDAAVSGYLDSRNAHFKMLRTQYINLVVFKVIIAAGLLLIGGLLVINQLMNIGQFVASEIIIILVLASVEKLIVSVETIYDVLTAVEKIGRITDIPLEQDSKSTYSFAENEGIDIKISNLSYRFDDANEDILKNIDLNIQAGEKLCISGFNGSGKSMLLQIIAGLYGNFKGSLVFNNIPLGNWSMEEIRNLTGDNIAKGSIFKGTLYENISLGKPEITFDQIQQVSSILGLTPFVEQWPKGFDTLLLPEGKNLPQSIRQKILLARSIVGNPKIILLEDHFASIDENDRSRFISYLLNTVNTVILISNDPEIAKRFDRNIVMNKGEIIADGKFSSFKRKKWFNQLFKSE